MVLQAQNATPACLRASLTKRSLNILKENRSTTTCMFFEWYACLSYLGEHSTTTDSGSTANLENRSSLTVYSVSTLTFHRYLSHSPLPYAPLSHLYIRSRFTRHVFSKTHSHIFTTSALSSGRTAFITPEALSARLVSNTGLRRSSCWSSAPKLLFHKCSRLRAGWS